LTGHQDRPDIRQRRRITQLRKDLGLTPVPPHVGTELCSIAPRVSDQVAGLLRQDPACASLSLEGQRLLVSAVARAMDEFARLVEDRHLRPRPPKPSRRRSSTSGHSPSRAASPSMRPSRHFAT
jgi:hypothetical protein